MGPQRILHAFKGSPFFQPRTLGCGTVEVCQEGEDVNLDLLDVPLILRKVNRCVSMTGVICVGRNEKAFARSGMISHMLYFEENKVMGEKMQDVRIVLISTCHSVSITTGTIHGYCMVLEHQPSCPWLCCSLAANCVVAPPFLVDG